MFFRLFFIPTLLLSDFSLPLSSYLSFPPFVASLGILSGSSLSLLFAPVFPFPSRSRSFFPIYLLPLLPPSPSASPLLRPCCLSRCLPKVARPNVAAPFVDITQSGCLPPCRMPLAWCRPCSSAIIARCYYVPPTILVPPMLVDAVDHLVHYCLLALSLLLLVEFSPSQARYSSLWCLFVFSSLPLHRRSGLCGTSLWHIVRLVLQCSSPPLRYPAWVLSSPHYDPFMTASPLFL